MERGTWSGPASRLEVKIRIVSYPDTVECRGAELFNHLSEVRKGDVFTLYVLDRILTYEIIRIQTCLPEETDLLKIREGEDLCTLVTCTPYGINSHRLLITGKRIHEEPVVTATAESSTKDSLLWISLGTLLWMAGWMHTLLR